jgi:hypothetical protein
MDVQSTVISRIGSDDLEITEYKHKQSMDEIEGRDMIESTEKVSSRLQASFREIRMHESLLMNFPDLGSILPWFNACVSVIILTQMMKLKSHKKA